MQKLKLLLPLALLICAFFVACHEEDPFDNAAFADVTFAGRIIDEIGEGVAGAQVKAGGESALTDKNGVFRLKSVHVPAMHALITVSKEGFFEVSRPYIVEDEAMQTVTIQLLSKVFEGSIISATGGEINVQDGPKLKFPANAFIDANGNAFNGQANVYARYLDPVNPNLGLFVPGDMTAENATNDEVFLSTYGMIGVEIVAGDGQKLNLAPGKEVQLRMPISSSQLASAPAEIPLWHYDLEEGHWKEEGSAQKVGNEYIGKVAHFSFWNCDAPFPLTQLHGKIYLENSNQPLTNALVRLTMLSTGGQSFAYTDANGNYGGCIPKDELLKLEVVLPANCGAQVLYTHNIGPFPGVSTLSPITIPASAQVPVLKVEGKLVDCNNQPITNGYVKLDWGNDKQYYMFANGDGSFKYVAVLCDNSTQTGSIIGYDLTNLLESNPIVVSTPPNAVNLSNIPVCNAISEYIQYTIDGQSFTKVDPQGGLDVTSTSISTPQDSTLNSSLQFHFINSGQIGTFPIAGLTVNQLSFDNQAANTLSTTVTAYGSLGNLIVGTFGGTFQEFGGASHTISGSYRVIQEW